MAKRLEDRQTINRRTGGPVIVSLYEVGGTVRSSTWTVEVRRGGSRRHVETGIANQKTAASRYQSVISQAEHGVYD